MKSVIAEQRKKSYQHLKGILREKGFSHTIYRLIKYFRYSNLRKQYSYVKGIKSGIDAYRGPYTVQIDLTDKCNNDCLGCWCNSSLLKGEKEKLSLSYNLLNKVIDELNYLGTREIILSGGGEPLMYPSIIEIIRKIKKRRMICHLNTNFTLADERTVRELIRLKLDYLTVSIWTANAKTYKLIHPSKSEEDFNRIKDRLKLLNSSKNGVPQVKIYNVIFNINYRDTEEMLDFAEEVKADYVEYAVLDTVPGKTDILLMNSSELSSLKEICGHILNNNRRIKILNFEHFVKRISSEAASCGEYDRDILEGLPCYSGWLFSRILANGNVIPCLKAHRFPVGNIYQNKFSQIWNGELMQEFRRKTISSQREESFFSLIGNGNDAKIGCYRICDDLPRNLNMHNKLNSWIYLEGIMARLMR